MEKAGESHSKPPKSQDVARDHPVLNLKDMTLALYEPRAGVLRARRACEVVAEAFRQAGGQVVPGYASLGEKNGNRLQNIPDATGPAATLRADTYVFSTRAVAAEGVSGTDGAEDPHSSWIRPLFRNTAGRRSLHVSQPAELQLPGSHRLARTSTG